MNTSPPSDWQPDQATIHAYVDGRLDPDTHARMHAWLDAHPAQAAEIRGWQHDAQQLRAAWGDPPRPATYGSLDPAHIRSRRRRRRHARMAQAAALLLALGVGGFGGWQARHLAATGAGAPMADAVQAYRMFAGASHANLDIRQRHPGELQAWLDRHFQRATPLPNLETAGFRPVGGRLMATDSGAAAMVVYRNHAGDAISFYIRPPSAHTGPIPRGQRRDGQLATAYWSGNGYNYALVGQADDAGMFTPGVGNRSADAATRHSRG